MNQCANISRGMGLSLSWELTKSSTSKHLFTGYRMKHFSGFKWQECPWNVTQSPIPTGVAQSDWSQMAKLHIYLFINKLLLDLRQSSDHIDGTKEPITFNWYSCFCFKHLFEAKTALSPVLCRESYFRVIIFKKPLDIVRGSKITNIIIKTNTTWRKPTHLQFKNNNKGNHSYA